MSLHLGELTIGLQLENDSLRPGINQAKRELESLPPVAQREVRKITREFDVEGRKSGGALAQGVRQGFIRNSPVIAAAVGGALAAGAPVALAGAGILFGGIAGVALSQNEAVASSYRQLGQQIRQGAIADSAIVAPAFVRMASDIGAAFEELRPQVRDALGALRPQLDDVSDGVIGLARNAMPGLVRAVQSSAPVMEGLQHLLEVTGTGLTGFFDAMSAHAPAAGAAMAAIGDILAELLPTLGNLLGTGSELAATVLPPLASALGAVSGALEAIGPILPAIVAGFVGMKAAQGVAGWVNNLAGGFSNLAVRGAVATGAITGSATAGGRVERSMSGVARTLRGVGTALPILGVGFALVAADMQRQEEQARANASAFEQLFLQMRQGGPAAQQARAGLEEAAGAAGQFAQQGWVGEAAGRDLAAAMEAGKEAAERQTEALDPLVSMQQTAEAAQSTLNAAVRHYGENSPEVAAAAAGLANANTEVSRQASAAQMATYGLTDAIAAQLNQALTAANADLAYRDAVDQVQVAQEALTEAVRDHGRASEEADDAGRQLEASMLAQVDAAGRLATEGLPATTDQMTRNAIAAQAQLTELERLRSTMGGTLPPALEQARASLAATVGSIDQTTVSTNVAIGQIQGLGLSVTALPNGKYIKVDAPTAAQQQQMRDLGYLVTTLPDGTVVVTANTGGAEAQLDALTRTRYMTIIAETVQGSSSRAASVGNLARQLDRASGGPVQGPGTETSDEIPVNLSNNEHVLTAREVRAAGGHGAVMRWRKSLLDGRPGYASGGPVLAEDGTYVNASFYSQVAGPSEASLLASADRRRAKGIALTPEQAAAVARRDGSTSASSDVIAALKTLRLEIGADGFVRFVDARVDQRLETERNYRTMAGRRF